MRLCLPQDIHQHESILYIVTILHQLLKRSLHEFRVIVDPGLVVEGEDLVGLVVDDEVLGVDVHDIGLDDGLGEGFEDGGLLVFGLHVDQLGDYFDGGGFDTEVVGEGGQEGVGEAGEVLVEFQGGFGNRVDLSQVLLLGLVGAVQHHLLQSLKGGFRVG